MRFAFYGRVSTEDAQDPSLSIPRQLSACQRVINDSGGQLVALFWDIESGRKNLSARGNGANRERFAVAVPRDGGIHDLLHAAGDGAFDAVIVESIDRLSRMTADATRIERDLEQLDIGLFATDEPMVANATAVLTRRVKQGVAEWYVRDLIEKSRRGMCNPSTTASSARSAGRNFALRGGSVSAKVSAMITGELAADHVW